MIKLSIETSINVFIGTYTSRYEGKGKGIYAATVDPETGSLSSARVAATAVDPSFLIIHPTRPLLYEVGRVSVDGKQQAELNAYEIKATRLNPMTGQPTGHGAPCHLIMDGGGKYVLSTVYGTGTI